MRNKKLKLLAAAIAATALLAGSMVPVFSLETSAVQFIADLNTTVSSGKISDARAALVKLSDLGVKQLKVGGKYYQIAHLIAMMDDPAMALSIVQQLLEALSAANQAAFVMENRVIVSLDLSKTADQFPTSSTA
ncbi:hypothetical protein [Devosia sp.]|uniref:hypothetical protein n=1 Tax=Devosia sp. TaxID=1871048 RepID=UPI003BAACB26